VKLAELSGKGDYLKDKIKEVGTNRKTLIITYRHK
jgi:hypothetical protein